MSINYSNFDLIFNPAEKYVIQLENNSLRVVKLKETSIWQRVAAWFGFGNLNLKNIENVIAKNENLINLNEPDQKIFYKKFSKKCDSFNKRHFFSKINKNALRILAKKSALCSMANFETDTTYQPGLVNGNVDFCYANAKLGFGYVLDGSGHNNSLMQPVLEKLLNSFNQSYELALKEQSFEDLNSAQQFVQAQFESLAQKMQEDKSIVSSNYSFTLSDPSMQPAISFVQIVVIDHKFYVLSFDLGDTALIIKKADDSFDHSLNIKKGNIGLGSGKIEIKIAPIQSGDTIYGFSDGIGEFLTLEEIEEIILNNPSDLIGKFKKTIIEKGKMFRGQVDYREEKLLTGNQKSTIKYHTFNSEMPAYHDDIGLFSLAV